MKTQLARNAFFAAALAIAFTLCAHAAAAQSRVSFKRGATSAVLTGSLSNYKQKRIFVVRVRRGQVMHIRDIGSHPVSVWVEGPRGSGYEQDLAADCHGQTIVDPTSAGDYILTVQECQKADRWRGRFRVRVTVR
jgi:hypothetical protein